MFSSYQPGQGILLPACVSIPQPPVVSIQVTPGITKVASNCILPLGVDLPGEWGWLFATHTLATLNRSCEGPEELMVCSLFITSS